ncbi:bifunctional 4-hydroxy-2-oxoglutarate aldolase/2-dehydro-3-deoxy-phosphogluconate aldolase [Flavobacterium psychrotrophum]|uniref:bifunctional 4-hydroxy-2-oxoglutarate aldolase/2-dehydro-3-deoxy-phosphogluconate aldolase n=1 Tax=Flavobacterium psychrotrophum TaxID=2294119 RepID=UPI000E315362|nr:bifunctional 4-hydroxy-2-oxoglutarate aldolase/2-dehydro-3-deoxy-phosphogluconate aldolase [Flavobacterium psychrotrophum]
MNPLFDTIAAYPLVPIYYNDNIADCIDKIDSCYKGGVRVFEFVNRGPLALANFEALQVYRDANWPELKFGIGTIKTKEHAQDFAALKPDFMVSPVVDKKVAKVARKNNIPWIPGAMTPTEVAWASSLGAELVKLFPGDTLSPDFVKAIKPVFPEVRFMVTGGVIPEEKNIKTWFAAGVTAVGLGSKLFQDADADEIQTRICNTFKWLSL